MGLLKAICFLVGLLNGACAQTLELSENLCEEIVDDAVVYKACTSEPLHVMQTTEYRTIISPEDATCGNPPVQYRTLENGNYHWCNTDTPSQTHAIPHMFDRLEDDSPDLDTWWQSVTWSNFPRALEVNLTFSFNKSHELSDILQITFESSRPREMKIFTSRDYGETWGLLQVYSSDCTQFPDLSPIVTADNPDAIICTEEFSHVTPYSNGTVEFSARERFQLFLGDEMSNFPALYEAFDTTGLDELMQFTAITFQLLYPNTDGIPNPGDLDLMKYYYAISDVDLVAGCYCNLHGKTCRIAEGYRVCNCEHNTAGDNCEKCLPLYNNRPWQTGHYLPYPQGTANECQKCECHDHATVCEFNTALGTGVCLDCFHNTAGIHCQECEDGYIRDPLRTNTDPLVCQDCQCEPLGVVAGDMRCVSPSGQCTCEPLVEGLKCVICTSGYYGLLQVEPLGECKPCNCHIDGEVNGDADACEPEEGICTCKPHITGRDCSECAPGYFNFPQGAPSQDCEPCDCALGASTSTVCTTDMGQCPCRLGLHGLRCTEVTQGMYVAGFDALQFQPAAGTCERVADIWSHINPFTGRYYYLCEESQYVDLLPETTLNLGGIAQTWYGWPVLRYTLNATSFWETLILEWTIVGHAGQIGCPGEHGIIRSIVISNLEPGVGMARRSPEDVPVDVRCVYSMSIRVGSSGSVEDPLVLDSVVLLPDYSDTDVYSQADPEAKHSYDMCVEPLLGLSTASSALNNHTCSQFVFSAMAQIMDGTLACDCDPTGASSTNCVPAGGQCHCRDGVSGRQCDVCAPGYQNFTQMGCELCPYLPCPGDLQLSGAEGGEDGVDGATVGLALAICILIILLVLVLVILFKRNFHRKVVAKLITPGPPTEVSYINVNAPNTPIYTQKTYADDPTPSRTESSRGSFSSVDRYNATMDVAKTNEAFAMQELPERTRAGPPREGRSRDDIKPRAPRQEPPPVEVRKPRESYSSREKVREHRERRPPSRESRLSDASSHTSRGSRQLPQIPAAARGGSLGREHSERENRQNEERERRQRPSARPRRQHRGRRNDMDEIEGSLV